MRRAKPRAANVLSLLESTDCWLNWWGGYASGDSDRCIVSSTVVSYPPSMICRRMRHLSRLRSTCLDGSPTKTLPLGAVHGSVGSRSQIVPCHARLPERGTEADPDRNANLSEIDRFDELTADPIEGHRDGPVCCGRQDRGELVAAHTGDAILLAQP